MYKSFLDVYFTRNYCRFQKNASELRSLFATPDWNGVEWNKFCCVVNFVVNFVSWLLSVNILRDCTLKEKLSCQ